LAEAAKAGVSSAASGKALFSIEPNDLGSVRPGQLNAPVGRA
jgi:hypothetical protein